MSRYTDIELQNKKLPPIGGYWNENLMSLELALKPVESLFNELPRSIKTAKRHCTFPSEHGLTRDESAAVYLYTMEGGQNSFYRVLNNALRSENRPALKIWFPYLKLFDVAIAKLPTIKASIWRGVPGNVSEQFKRGQVFTWWSISSCSQSVDVIQDFLGTASNSTLFMIEATSAKDISSYSYYPSENEIVLSMGTELRVKSDSLKHAGGLNIVHLIQINNDSDSESGDDDKNDVSEKLPENVGQTTLKAQTPETYAISK